MDSTSAVFSLPSHSHRQTAAAVRMEILNQAIAELQVGKNEMPDGTLSLSPPISPFPSCSISPPFLLWLFHVPESPSQIQLVYGSVVSSASGSGWSLADRRLVVHSQLKPVLPLLALLQKFLHNHRYAL